MRQLLLKKRREHVLFLSRNFPLPVDHVQTESYLRKTDFTLLSDTIFGHISHSLHDPTYTKDRYLFAYDRNTWVHLICIAYMHAFIPSCATFIHTDKWTTSKTLHWYFMYISFFISLGIRCLHPNLAAWQHIVMERKAFDPKIPAPMYYTDLQQQVALTIYQHTHCTYC